MQAGNGFDAFVSAFGVYQNNLYAGGGFSTSGPDTMNRIARWDGAMWQALAGGGIDEDTTLSAYSYVNAIKEFNGQLFAGGYFTKAGNIASGNIAIWDGNMWLPCPFSFDSFVSTLSIYNNKLFIGGFFNHQPPSVHAACSWDGLLLDDLQGGILAPWNSKTVWASEVFNNKIYFGGNMPGNYQGNIFSEGLIAWDEFNITSAESFSGSNPVVYPNPSSGKFSIFDEQIKGEFTISIHDLSGKLIVQKSLDAMLKNSIDVTLTAGIYTLLLNTNENLKYCKLIIVN